MLEFTPVIAAAGFRGEFEGIRIKIADRIADTVEGRPQIEPVPIHFEEIDEGEPLIIELILKGGGCENVGAQYKLPDNRLGAGRDLEGVRKVVLDAVHQAQGKGCAPGALGVAIGGDRGASYLASKEALFRNLEDQNPDEVLAELEARLTDEANQLGVGPMGFGGKTTVLGTKIKGLHRLPASYFVSVSYMCWAYRRRKMTYQDGQVVYE